MCKLPRRYLLADFGFAANVNRGSLIVQATGKNLRQSGPRPHPCSVRHSGPVSLLRRVGAALPSFQSLHLSAFRFAVFCRDFCRCGIRRKQGSPAPRPQAASSQAAVAFDHVAGRSSGTAVSGRSRGHSARRGRCRACGLELLRLGTTARLMQVVAHPDDEDGGMLTLEARGHGVSTLLMTLNRGEGGQNKIGSNLSDVLGVLRAEELLASDQYYGVQERFSRVADFGFSKNARRDI